MVLGQDMFHFIRPLEYFETDRKTTPIAVPLTLDWVLSGPLPSSLGLFSTCFKVVTQGETNSKLADQIRSWYDIESYEPINKWTRALLPTREQRRSFNKPHTMMDPDITLVCSGLMAKLVYRTTIFSALVQLKSLERRLGKDPKLKERYFMTIRDDLSKNYIIKVEKSN